jgi:hypothetical protein
VTLGWYSYLGYDQRRGSLFNRAKTQVLHHHPRENIYTLSGHLNDSYHGLAVEFTFDESFTVKDISGLFLRAPDPVCEEAISYLTDFVGKNLASLPKRDIASLLGKGHGCTHLIDVVADGADTLRLFTAEMKNSIK